MVAAVAGFAQSGAAAAADSPQFFENRIRPLLANNCFGCHTNTAMGGLRLDSADALIKGGKRGLAVVSGDPDKSLLIQAVRHSDASLKMPMGNKPKDAEIADLSAWVKSGAVWPKSAVMAIAKSNDGKFVILPDPP